MSRARRRKKAKKKMRSAFLDFISETRPVMIRGWAEFWAEARRVNAVR